MGKIGTWGLFIVFITFLNAADREQTDPPNSSPDGYGSALPILMAEVPGDPSLENPPLKTRMDFLYSQRNRKGKSCIPGLL